MELMNNSNMNIIHCIWAGGVEGREELRPSERSSQHRPGHGTALRGHGAVSAGQRQWALPLRPPAAPRFSPSGEMGRRENNPGRHRQEWGRTRCGAPARIRASRRPAAVRLSRCHPGPAGARRSPRLWGAGTAGWLRPGTASIQSRSGARARGPAAASGVPSRAMPGRAVPRRAVPSRAEACHAEPSSAAPCQGESSRAELDRSELSEAMLS